MKQAVESVAFEAYEEEGDDQKREALVLAVIEALTEAVGTSVEELRKVSENQSLTQWKRMKQHIIIEGSKQHNT